MFCKEEPKIFSRGIVTRLQRNTRLPEEKVTDGCKHPCSTLLHRYVFSISLPHPCHNIGPLIYDDCAVCCIHCGPARGPSPLSDAGILCVCDHWSHGTRLCDYDPCENHSGHHAHVSSPPLALRKLNLCCLVFLSQKFLACEGLCHHCDGCGVGWRKSGAGISWRVPPVLPLQCGNRCAQGPYGHSSGLLEIPATRTSSKVMRYTLKNFPQYQIQLESTKKPIKF